METKEVTSQVRSAERRPHSQRSSEFREMSLEPKVRRLISTRTRFCGRVLQSDENCQVFVALFEKIFHSCDFWLSCVVFRVVNMDENQLVPHDLLLNLSVNRSIVFLN
ncbi:hypothetical protein NL108_016224 [Boleophthalmus pectinirostris]|nr:hypothetical protein NL108_016224 [Boleophthalmus pectinirostris]